MTFRLGFVLLVGLSSASHAFAGGAGDSEGDLNFSLFRTPSRNIYCGYNVTEKFLRCERLSPSYKLVDLSRSGVTKLNFNANLKEEYGIWAGSYQLSYGKTWKAPNANFKCTSTPSGLTCDNGRGHGFKMSKASVSTY